MNITIFGNGGGVTIDDTGKPTRYVPSLEVQEGEHDGYGDIIRFDVVEWRAHYGRDLPGSLDILDIGYWYSGGPDMEVAYEPAEPEFRRPRAII